MINVHYFIKALKVSWLRRIIQNSQDTSGYSLSMIDFFKDIFAWTRLRNAV